MKSTKRLILPILVVMLLAMLCAFVAVNPVNLTANAEVNVAANYRVLNGAQIRTESPDGIRFVTEIANTTKTQYGADAEYGVIIVPEHMIDGELTLNTANVIDVPTGKWIENYNVVDYSAFNSVLSGEDDSFPNNFYNTPLAVRAYVKYGTNNASIAYSENTVVRSIAYVAKIATISDQATADLISDIAQTATQKIVIQNNAETYVYGTDTNYGLTLKVGGVTVESDDNITLEFDSENSNVLAVENGAFKVMGAGKTNIVATVTSKNYNGENNSFTVKKEITVEKKSVTLTEKQLFDKYVANGTYSVDIKALDGAIESVTFTDKNNAENVVKVNELTLDETALSTGYYNLEVETENVIYKADAVVADKVINNKDELKNWPYYIRPANWANNIALEYDGLIVLGDDIDWGGRQIASDGKDTNKYVNELAAKFAPNTTETAFFIPTTSYNSVLEWTSKTDYIKIADGYKPVFVGTFDGLGHNISNLFLAHNGLGMFGTYCSGTIKNISFTGLHITGYRKGAISFDFTGAADGIFLEGLLLSTNTTTGLLAGQCLSTPNLKRISAVLSEGVNNREDAGILIGSAAISDTSSEIVGNIYGIGNLGLLVYKQGGVLYDAADKCYLCGKAENLDNFIDAKYNINSFTSEYWNTENGFPIMNSAIGKLTKINLQATDGSGAAVTEVSAGASVNIDIVNYKTGAYTNNQAGFSTITVNQIDGVTYADGVLTVADSVAVGTEIVLTVTNNLDGAINTLKLTVK